MIKPGLWTSVRTERTFFSISFSGWKTLLLINARSPRSNNNEAMLLHVPVTLQIPGRTMLAMEGATVWTPPVQTWAFYILNGMGRNHTTVSTLPLKRVMLKERFIRLSIHKRGAVTSQAFVSSLSLLSPLFLDPSCQTLTMSFPHVSTWKLMRMVLQLWCNSCLFIFQTATLPRLSRKD